MTAIFIVVLVAAVAVAVRRDRPSVDARPRRQPAPQAFGTPLHLHFDGRDRVVATEHDRRDPDLEPTSGSLVIVDGNASSGPPDAGVPDPRHGTTHSAVFRVRTRRDDFSDVAVSLRIRNDGLSHTRRTPARPFDGVSLGLRYRSPDELYYVNLQRRDGQVVVKKKSEVEGRVAYVTLAAAHRPVPYGAWDEVRVTVGNDGGSVDLSVAFGGVEVLRARDDGRVWGPPITAPGRVLLRGDNCRFSFNDLDVRALT